MRIPKIKKESFKTPSLGSDKKELQELK